MDPTSQRRARVGAPRPLATLPTDARCARSQPRGGALARAGAAHSPPASRRTWPPRCGLPSRRSSAPATGQDLGRGGPRRPPAPGSHRPRTLAASPSSGGTRSVACPVHTLAPRQLSPQSWKLGSSGSPRRLSRRQDGRAAVTPCEAHPADSPAPPPLAPTSCPFPEHRPRPSSARQAPRLWPEPSGV